MDRILTKYDVDKFAQLLLETCDALLTYEQAAEILGKTKGAIAAKVSRSVIEPVRLPPMLRYSDVLRIKNKEV